MGLLDNAIANARTLANTAADTASELVADTAGKLAHQAKDLLLPEAAAAERPPVGDLEKIKPTARAVYIGNSEEVGTDTPGGRATTHSTATSGDSRDMTLETFNRGAAAGTNPMTRTEAMEIAFDQILFKKTYTEADGSAYNLSMQTESSDFLSGIASQSPKNSVVADSINAVAAFLIYKETPSPTAKQKKDLEQAIEKGLVNHENDGETVARLQMLKGKFQMMEANRSKTPENKAMHFNKAAEAYAAIRNDASLDPAIRLEAAKQEVKALGLFLRNAKNENPQIRATAERKLSDDGIFQTLEELKKDLSSKADKTAVELFSQKLKNNIQTGTSDSSIARDRERVNGEIRRHCQENKTSIAAALLRTLP